MNEQTFRFRLGIFVLAALLLLAVLIVLFGSLPDWFKSYQRYTILFDDAAGLAPGAPVRQAGVRIGEVEQVGLDEESGKARVRVKVERRFLLRQADQPVLVRGLIGGDTTVDFVRRAPRGAPPDLRPLEPESILQGMTPAEPGDLGREAAQLLPTVRQALENMDKVLSRLDKVVPLLEQTLREFRDTAATGREAIPVLRSAAAEVRELAKLARSTLPEIGKTGEELRTAARSWGKVGDRVEELLRRNQERLNRVLDNLDTTLQRTAATFSEENQRLLRDGLQRANDTLSRANLLLGDLQQASKPLAERAPSLLRNLDEASLRLNQTLSEVQQLLRGSAPGGGTVQRFLTDPSLYNRLEEAACRLNRLLPRLDHILQDVEIFADKIARHPESLGLGGVLRPGTGLKETPPFYYLPGR